MLLKYLNTFKNQLSVTNSYKTMQIIDQGQPTHLDNR